MITDIELTETRNRLAQVEEVIAQQRENMKQLCLSEEQVSYAVQPCLCFRDQLQEELDSLKE
jgi:hypothetical protein